MHPLVSLRTEILHLQINWECNQIVFQVQTLLDSVKWDDKGLAVVKAQNVDKGAILMQGFANRDAVATLISSRKATFYCRSRSMLWTKGETSNNSSIFTIFFLIVIVTMYVLKTSTWKILAHFYFSSS